MKKQDVENELTELGYVDKGEAPPQEGNNSKYNLWQAEGKPNVFLGNFFVEIETDNEAFPYAEEKNTEQDLLVFLGELVECPTCEGAGEAYFSCCTGDLVTDDYKMCPECHEHLGENTCDDCSGTGYVRKDADIGEVPRYDAQLAAEKYSER